MKLAFRNKPGAQNLIVLQDAYHGRSLVTIGSELAASQQSFPADSAAALLGCRIQTAIGRGLDLDIETETELCLNLLEDTIDKGVDGGVAAIMSNRSWAMAAISSLAKPIFKACARFAPARHRP